MNFVGSDVEAGISGEFHRVEFSKPRSCDRICSCSLQTDTGLQGSCLRFSKQRDWQCYCRKACRTLKPYLNTSWAAASLWSLTFLLDSMWSYISNAIYKHDILLGNEHTDEHSIVALRNCRSLRAANLDSVCPCTGVALLLIIHFTARYESLL